EERAKKGWTTGSQCLCAPISAHVPQRPNERPGMIGKLEGGRHSSLLCTAENQTAGPRGIITLFEEKGIKIFCAPQWTP
ncbi:hypothetical protein, partial [Akkermansia sp.]|uniref:hypothetical protein n=1 Tax=Akkermansia sp. TaxID=1872421 RepID=UPI003A880209